MAIAKVGTDTETFYNGTGTIQFSHTLVSGSNKIIIVTVNLFTSIGSDTPTTSSATYDGVSLTNAISYSNFRVHSSVWYILDTNLSGSGSKTVEVQIANNSTYHISCAEYTGVNQGAPEATDSNYEATAHTVTNTISPTNDAWVFSGYASACIFSGTPTLSSDNGQVHIFEHVSGAIQFASIELRGANGETSLSTTRSGSVILVLPSCRVAASFQAAGGWTNIAKFDGVAAASISKINGVSAANISKINGVSV